MRYLIIPLLVLGLVLSYVPAQARMSARDSDLVRIDKASSILQEIMSSPDSSIPQDLLRQAYAIAVFPNVVKGAFLVGARWGQGVIVARSADGSWSAPSFLNIVGGNFGFQIGAEVTDLVLVFRTARSVEALGRGDLTLGATASVAAGPVGRSGQASTDWKLAAEILSYSKTRGLFAGVALDGTVLEVDSPANNAMFGSPDPLRYRASRMPEPARHFSCLAGLFSGTSGRTYCS